jgi:glycosyltransferase involved in cell wall biosynthesis
MRPYVLVSGDFVQTGGMDRANYALADHLLRQGHEVHLVAHRVGAGLLGAPNAHFHRVVKPLGSDFLGEEVLDRTGRSWARWAAARGGRVVTNAGNCRAAGVSWVHYVHAAYRPEARGGPLARRLRQFKHRSFLRKERQALARARLVIANSQRTRADLVERLGLPPERIRVIYYAANNDLFRPASDAERADLRRGLGWPVDRPHALFIGSPRDHRKGFDIVLGAWERLCGRPAWDVRLVVVGAGAEQGPWQHEAAARGLADHVHFLGLRRDIHDVHRACDLFVSPTRYEAYGLAAHEALCCALPTFITRTAGVAEHYPKELGRFLLEGPTSDDLAERLWGWRQSAGEDRSAVERLAGRLRSWTWEHMAGQLIALIEEHPG